jgi:hypothetical protein
VQLQYVLFDFGIICLQGKQAQFMHVFLCVCSHSLYATLRKTTISGTFDLNGFYSMAISFCQSVENYIVWKTIAVQHISSQVDSGSNDAKLRC